MSDQTDRRLDLPAMEIDIEAISACPNITLAMALFESQWEAGLRKVDAAKLSDRTLEILAEAKDVARDGIIKGFARYEELHPTGHGKRGYA